MDFGLLKQQRMVQMANSGIIKQFRGPYKQQTQITLGSVCRIGVSMSEKDFMKIANENELNNFVFILNGQQLELSPISIQLGRTQIYEIEEGINISTIFFPNGAPASLLINCLYY